MGALLGKLSPEQYIIMGLFEVVFYCVNEYILFHLWTVSDSVSRNCFTLLYKTCNFQVTDAGDSMTVHTFGAYFGLTIARIMYRKGQVGHHREGSSYTSDIFAMVGTYNKSFLRLVCADLYHPSGRSEVAMPFPRAIIRLLGNRLPLDFWRVMYLLMSVAKKFRPLRWSVEMNRTCAWISPTSFFSFRPLISLSKAKIWGLENLRQNFSYRYDFLMGLLAKFQRRPGARRSTP